MSRIVIIDRTKWMRGEDGAVLWDIKQNKGCCLGHVAFQAHGRSYTQMNGIGSPRDLALRECKKNPLCELAGEYDRHIHNAKYVNPKWVDRAMVLNDREGISSEEREKKLIKLFKENGYTVSFIN